MKKMNKKGFAISTMLYGLIFVTLAVFYIILTIVLNRQQSNTNNVFEVRKELQKVVIDNQIENETIEPVTAASFIASLPGLENVADAYRYVGANPDNYVWFNNEQWRIIGVYEDKLKIIKATPSTTSQVWNSLNNNIWNVSTIQNYLYNTYYPTLLTDTKAMIEIESWNIGECGTNITASDGYACARTTTWTGKIGLIATYEYLYAAEKSCWTTIGYNYGTGCSENDWLFSTLTSNKTSYAWTIGSSSERDDSSLCVLKTGMATRSLVSSGDGYAASPVVYLKSSVKITGGNGKIGEANSYKLKYEEEDVVVAGEEERVSFEAAS